MNSIDDRDRLLWKTTSWPFLNPLVQQRSVWIYRLYKSLSDVKVLSDRAALVHY